MGCTIVEPEVFKEAFLKVTEAREDDLLHTWDFYPPTGDPVTTGVVTKWLSQVDENA